VTRSSSCRARYGSRVSLTKIANDLVLMGSGPRCGLAEIFLPELQKGSSIMPGKVNPVIPEVVLQVGNQVVGNDAAIAIGRQPGQLRAERAGPADRAQPAALDQASLGARACSPRSASTGSSPTSRRCERYAESTPAIATALNPYIGYDRATEIVKEAVASRRTIREVALEKGVGADVLDRALDLAAMARGESTAGRK
jgi:fumarate hydratase class II